MPMFRKPPQSEASSWTLMTFDSGGLNSWPRTLRMESMGFQVSRTLQRLLLVLTVLRDATIWGVKIPEGEEPTLLAMCAPVVKRERLEAGEEKGPPTRCPSLRARMLTSLAVVVAARVKGRTLRQQVWCWSMSMASQGNRDVSDPSVSSQNSGSVIFVAKSMFPPTWAAQECSVRTGPRGGAALAVRIAIKGTSAVVQVTAEARGGLVGAGAIRVKGAALAVGLSDW